MCNCFETKLQEIDSRAQELSGVVASHSRWSDESLNFLSLTQRGLSVTTHLKLRKSSDRSTFELNTQNSSIGFAFCPFCGEKLDNKVLHLTQEEDDALLKIFYDLEENLETKLESITVSGMDEAIKLVDEEMQEIGKTFLLQRDDERQVITLLHKGNFQESTIEIFLEPDEDGNENLYTLSVF